MRRIRPRAALVPLLVTLVAAGCVASASIDGFTLGSIEKCSGGVGPVNYPDDGSPCRGGRELAAAALDSREPGHPRVVSVEMYADGTQPGPIDVTGDAPPPTPAPRHPGPMVTVFVFTLADGSRRATGVACGDFKPTVCLGVASYPN